jgi:hypothetical protein
MLFLYNCLPALASIYPCAQQQKVRIVKLVLPVKLMFLNHLINVFVCESGWWLHQTTVRLLAVVSP